MTRDELKQIRLYRQHLTAPADIRTVVRDLNGVQAQFMSAAVHALRIRCTEKIGEAVPAGGLVKNWTIRGTVHVFDERDLPLFKNSIARCRSEDFRGYGFFDEKRLQWGLQKPYGEELRIAFERDGRAWMLTPERQKFWSSYIIGLVADGVEERDALKEACRAAGMTEAEADSMFDPWGGGMRELCERGFLHYKVQEKKAFALTAPFTPMGEAPAETAMAERYFLHYAPAAVRDAAYCFGWTQTKTKAVMARLPLRRIAADNTELFYLGELPTAMPPIPPCILLAGFDPLMLGYRKEESIFLPAEYLRRIFNLAGIVMPAILLDGTVAGRWRRKGHRLTAEMFRECSAGERRAVIAAAEKWFGEIKVVFA